MERKLASIQEVASVFPINGADNIECIMVQGWPVVVKRGQFRVGDHCVYFEIDSFLPIKDEYEFLRKNCFHNTPNLGEGFRLKTIKLRGQLSQGLALPLIGVFEKFSGLELGTDLTDVLQVQKYEAPIPAQLAGQIEGMFPSFIPKTDQQRVQNLSKELKEYFGKGLTFEVTIKLDGSSCTIYKKGDKIGICSRNMELKNNEENKSNSFIRVAHDTGLVQALNLYNRNIAVQGELMGPGIQGNREGLKAINLFIFDIYDIDKRCYLNPQQRVECINFLHWLGYKGDEVPIVAWNSLLPSGDVQDILDYADGPSLHNKLREGLVFKGFENPEISFKAISNKFLWEG